MAKAILVEENIKVGEKILVELDKLIPDIIGAFWFLFEETEEWKLIFVSPTFDTKGPRFAYKLILDVLQKNSIEENLIAFEDISILPVSSPIFTLLKTAIKTGKDISNIRFRKNSINGVIIEDAMLYRVLSNKLVA
ncbi:hypothetical protein QM480_01895 [Flectobacillus sp. DC10W]|uniref:Uncharacterized protein n=1 Tax=Flectobacillus longus TaxID=2984207 RepID=A0ABT6YHJ9_9BACT|nr:hypothetical protein [Flectobacillus longus]MDI9863062.1 hypothetical protein [Flectobacillus longus]